MKTKLCLLLAVAASALGSVPAARAEDFYIRVELLLGASDLQERYRVESVVAMYPISNLIRSGWSGIAPDQPQGELSEDLARIYRLSQVYGLAQGTLRWDETTGWLPGVFMVERETFRLDLEPKFLPPKRMKLRLLVSRIRNKSGDLERVLDTDLVASLDDPVVSGFSFRGQPFFLSLLVTKTKPRAEGEAWEAGREPSREKAVTPLPVRRVDPKLPANVDPARLEGEVVLKVSVDESGRVTDVELLKSLQPDVDRETIKALKEWTFEPVHLSAGQKPTTFAISFRYRAPRWDSPDDLESEPFESAPEKEPKEPPAQDGLSGEIKPILASAADYCRKLSDAALDFTCEERIAEEIYEYVNTFERNSDFFAMTALKRLTKKNNLLYDFQMVKTAEGIRESRTLLEDNGNKTRQPNAPLLTKRFYSYRSLFGPVALFSKERQPFYDYRITGQDKVRGEKTWVIEAKPRAKNQADALRGKAWVTQGAGRIVKIEVDAESLVGYEKLSESYDLTWQLPLLTTTHFYEFEKNGILFPSRTVFKESFVVKGSQKRIQRSRTDIQFGGYRFFTVETETSIKD